MKLTMPRNSLGRVARRLQATVEQGIPRSRKLALDEGLPTAASLLAGIP
jgi:hypothetical protein